LAGLQPGRNNSILFDGVLFTMFPNPTGGTFYGMVKALQTNSTAQGETYLTAQIDGFSLPWGASVKFGDGAKEATPTPFLAHVPYANSTSGVFIVANTNVVGSSDLWVSQHSAPRAAVLETGTSIRLFVSI